MTCENQRISDKKKFRADTKLLRGVKYNEAWKHSEIITRLDD